MPDMKEEQIHQEFYTQDRWNNWLKQVKESGFKFNESEEGSGKEGALFVNMEDDVILACLKVISKYDRHALAGEDAFNIISQIRDIVLEEIEPVSDDVDLMIDSLQTSLMGGIVACECYVQDAYDKDAKIEDLIKAALGAEAADDIQFAIGYVAEIGASVLNGKTFPEDALEDIPYGFVAEWLDGIDSIAAAMVGSDSYKDDEADSES
ncbi:MAG: DUF2150 family protein [Methanosarcinaceae archaeon]|nr:DUF2150 family protein [Methanosarcinaceae archaeon]